MERLIVQSISGVISSLTVVDKKIASLRKTNQDQTLQSIQTQLPKLRRTLLSLISQVRDSDENLVLKNVSSQDGTLFEFAVSVLTASINTLKELLMRVKIIKHSGQRQASLRNPKDSVTDSDLLIFQMKIEFLHAALRVIVQIITL
jgi:hypothetical protein